MNSPTPCPDHFPYCSQTLYGRAESISYLGQRSSIPGGITAVCGRPMMGKTSLLQRVASLLEGRKENPMLVGYYEARGDADDVILRCVSDLYTHWLYKASYAQQLQSLLNTRKGHFLDTVGIAMTDLLKEAAGSLPIPGVVSGFLGTLLNANKELKTGGINIPLLEYDRARELLSRLREVTGQPVLLVLDAWEKCGVLGQANGFLAGRLHNFLDTYLHHPEDWKETHIFLGVRTENPERDLRPVMSAWKGCPTFEVHDVPPMALSEDEVRACLSEIRKSVAGAADISDSGLVGMMDGYPGVFRRWIDGKPKHADDLHRLAELAQQCRYPDIEELLQGLQGDERSLSARLVALPEMSTIEDWKSIHAVAIHGLPERALTNLKSVGLLDHRRPYPSFKHSTRYSTAQRWFTETAAGRPVLEEELQFLIPALSESCERSDEEAGPYLYSLASIIPLADDLDLPESLKMIPWASQMILAPELAHRMWTPVNAAAEGLVRAALESPSGAELCVAALGNMLEAEAEEKKDPAVLDEIIPRLSRIEQNAPGHPIAKRCHSLAYTVRANCKTNLGRFSEAFSDYERAIELYQDNGLVYVNYALARQRNGNPAEATDLCDKGIALGANGARSYWVRGAVRHDLGDFRGATDDFTIAINATGQLSRDEVKQCLCSRATSSSKLGETSAAIADFTSAIELEPTNADSYENLAWILATGHDDKYRNGRRAVDLATKACELDGWRNAHYLDTLAAAYAESGDLETAARWQVKALDVGGEGGLSGEDADEARARLDLYKSGLPYRQPK